MDPRPVQRTTTTPARPVPRRVRSHPRGSGPADHVDGAVLSNVRILGEGVDVPDADAVLFADPKRSASDIIQALGRALRQP
ncbi:helicase-related protein, partial [Streptomyces sp. enrichment culture]|uniref:helicase-related protein n=1 Tax=Streptomyces sp. enrichment culture TaxID=1795815 RepID=UPI003F546D9E